MSSLVTLLRGDHNSSCISILLCPCKQWSFRLLPGTHEGTTVETATTWHGYSEGYCYRGPAQGLLGKGLEWQMDEMNNNSSPSTSIIFHRLYSTSREHAVHKCSSIETPYSQILAQLLDIFSYIGLSISENNRHKWVNLRWFTNKDWEVFVYICIWFIEMKSKNWVSDCFFFLTTTSSIFVNNDFYSAKFHLCPLSYLFHHLRFLSNMFVGDMSARNYTVIKINCSWWFHFKCIWLFIFCPEGTTGMIINFVSVQCMYLLITLRNIRDFRGSAMLPTEDMAWW